MRAQASSRNSDALPARHQPNRLKENTMSQAQAPAQGYAAALINQTESLLAKLEADFAATTAFYESIGVDPANIDGAFGPPMSAKQRAEMAAVLAADQQAIDQEVAEGLARLRMSTPGAASTPKRPRNMI